MYKAKIQELETKHNKLLNKIKMQTNMHNYYENILNVNNEEWNETKIKAVNKVKFLKRKLIIGKIFAAGMIVAGITMFTSLMGPILIASEFVLIGGTFLLNYNAKNDRNCILKINDTLNKAQIQEESLKKLLESSQSRIDHMQEVLNQIDNKLKELKNAQETYDRISSKYSFKIDFNKKIEDCLDK